MIRLDNISKQQGHQILFIEASATLQKGEKAGLVGPNGGRQDNPVSYDDGAGTAR
jgi:ATPase subunit of ABC transporter with duplicated ATPase domains